ncbi:hypothetical protein [Dactylosporangium sp. CA-092794]|uniref:hypothetical protein n=1 Tax=Dactylosporangium sp. CA-092794 TaxID=3239929 RepID=UPI003D8FCD7B
MTAVRAFKDLLQALYTEAGRPTFAAVAEHAREIAGQAPTRHAIAAMLRGDTGLPSEDYAVLVGAALAHAAGHDPAATAERVRSAWHTAHAAARTLRGRRPGVPIPEADPSAFGVTPPSEPHPHDNTAARIVDAARAGASRVLALVGPPGSGRTRTAWAAVRTLPGLWRLWRPDGDLAAAGPYTVVWFADAGPPLDPDATDAAALAARLRTLVDDPHRAPVLVVLTLWPEHWSRLTAPPLPGEPDPHATARTLLRGSGVTVAPTSAGPWSRLTAPPLPGEPDPHATARSLPRGSGVTVAPTSAGRSGPLRRYEQAPPVARDLLDAAVDARRFGFPPWIPVAFLEATTNDPDTALRYATDASDGPAPLVADGERRYRLAEAVHRAGAAERAAVFPAERFWDALSAVTDPGVLRAAGAHAERRGRLRRAGQAYRLALAIDDGDTVAMARLAMLRERTGDRRGADRLAIAAAELGDPAAVEALALRADEDGDPGRADALARATAGDAGLLCALARRHPGTARAEALYRTAAERSPGAAAELAVIVHDRGDHAEAERYARQAAAGGDTSGLRRLAERHRRGGPAEAAERFAIAAAFYGHAFEHRLLRDEQRRLGKPGAVAALRRRLAADADPGELHRLDACLAASVTRATALAARLACRRHTGPLRALATERHRRGDRAGALRLAVIAGRCGDPSVLADIAVLTAAPANADPIGPTTAPAHANPTPPTTGPAHTDPTRRTTGPAHADATRPTTGPAHAGPTRSDDAIRPGDRAAPLGERTPPHRTAHTRRPQGEHHDDDAVRLAERAALLGDGSGLRRLARARGRDGDRKEAVRLLERAAAGGDPDALFDLARALHRAGDDGAEARYREAARGGVADAAEALARLLRDTDPTAAAAFARRAAELGHPTALRDLGQARERAGDRPAAAALYLRAAELGDDAAAQQLARLWDEHQRADAARLAAEAAERGHPAVLRHLGGLREQAGRAEEAGELYWSAYEAADPGALLRLPHLRAEDDGDRARADRLALRAARRGHERAVADLIAVRALTGDLAGAERLARRATAAGREVDLRPLIRLRLATDAPVPAAVAAVYERAGAHLVLARRHLDQGNPKAAAAQCVLAANRGDPAAVPELVRLHRRLGDRVSADMIERYGLADDGTPAGAW